MAMTDSDYLQALLSLLPPGKAYPRDGQGIMRAAIEAFAEELARIDARADNLIDEADPRTALETLADWERVLALTAQDTIAARRLAIESKLTEVGGQSRAYFIALAASLGYTITITEFRPFTCETDIDQGIYEDDCRFTWQVNLPATTVTEATCQSPCSEPLRSWGDDALEAAMNAKKPAHTTVLFAYGG